MNGEITSKEAAQLLNVTEGRIRQIILENRVRSRKVGNTRLIKRVDVMKIVQSKKEDQRSQAA
jgi:excisionase family DNA binding protein